MVRGGFTSQLSAPERGYKAVDGGLDGHHHHGSWPFRQGWFEADVGDGFHAAGWPGHSGWTPAGRSRRPLENGAQEEKDHETIFPPQVPDRSGIRHIYLERGFAALRRTNEKQFCTARRNERETVCASGSPFRSF